MDIDNDLMAIIEVEEQEILNPMSQLHTREAIYFYTALCGTCKLGERMLDIINSMDVHIPIRKLNINFAPVLRHSWQIKSVPCLVIVQHWKPVKFIYAMRSVDYLYENLKE